MRVIEYEDLSTHCDGVDAWEAWNEMRSMLVKPTDPFQGGVEPVSLVWHILKDGMWDEASPRQQLTY